MTENQYPTDDDDVTRIKSANTPSDFGHMPQASAKVEAALFADDATLLVIPDDNKQTPPANGLGLPAFAQNTDDVTQVASSEPIPAPRVPEDLPTVLNTQLGYAGNADNHLEVGSVIKDTFELVAVLGEGGMGAVFKALNKVWAEVEARDPYVAIKVLKPELSENKQLVRSLYSDFDRTKMLANCPNIIKVYGFDRDGPHVYITMEFLSGKTLGDYLNRTPMGLAQAWFIIEGIGTALAYAHANNIVHRDIKPGNVIITNDNVVKVLDFGIASKINEIEGDETKFGGHELGALTVAYASPEMQRDYPPDARDDIYAYACVIYEILTGKQFYKQKIQKAAPIPGLNSRQMEILNKSLAFERDQRTPTIQEILDKLRPVKTPWPKYAGIATGVVLAAGLAWWGVTQVPSTSEPAVQPITPAAVVTPQTTVSATPPPVVVTPTPVAPVVATPPAAVVPAPAAQPAVPVVAPVVVPPPTELSYTGISRDSVIQLQTSQPEYQNGDAFNVSFTLSEARYVRVLDRDANGVITVLRPNPRQPDQLLPKDKEQMFPPKGVKVPVQGTSGNCYVTIVASSQPIPKTLKMLNADGSVSEQIQNGAYSWVQVRYVLH